MNSYSIRPGRGAQIPSYLEAKQICKGPKKEGFPPRVMCLHFHNPESESLLNLCPPSLMCLTRVPVLVLPISFILHLRLTEEETCSPSYSFLDGTRISSPAFPTQGSRFLHATLSSLWTLKYILKALRSPAAKKTSTWLSSVLLNLIPDYRIFFP